jgi:hypothetical protein
MMEQCGLLFEDQQHKLGERGRSTVLYLNIQTADR